MSSIGVGEYLANIRKVLGKRENRISSPYSPAFEMRSVRPDYGNGSRRNIATTSR